jgi:hypothetical protein
MFIGVLRVVEGTGGLTGFCLGNGEFCPVLSCELDSFELLSYEAVEL